MTSEGARSRRTWGVRLVILVDGKNWRRCRGTDPRQKKTKAQVFNQISIK